MTKKEAAAVEARIEKCALRAALSWTAPVEPDVPIPERSYGDSNLSTGWLPVAAGYSSRRVDVACSGSVHHAIGRTDRTTTQQPKKLYSTKLLALRALRYETELRCAQQLREIDNQIEQAEAEQSA